jgi:hypothetical protein
MDVVARSRLEEVEMPASVVDTRRDETMDWTAWAVRRGATRYKLAVVI